MKKLPAIISLLLACTLQATARTFNFHQISFFPRGVITRFESTVIIPPGSSDPDVTPSSVRAFWPGLMPGPPGTVGVSFIQNVVTNRGGVPGECYLLPFYCCYPSGALVNQTRIYPTQALTNIYTLNADKNLILDTWHVESGFAKNLTSFTGSYTLDPNTHPTEKPDPPYQKATLAIELQENGTWDFGPLTWQNVIIVTQTEDTDWCKVESDLDNMIVSGHGGLVSKHGGYTTCYFANIQFERPN